jgi:hypothetical protein
MNQIKTSVTNDIGINFNVILKKDEESKNIVTFYDSRYKKNFTKFGQPIATYYANTLLGKDGSTGIKKYGLNLYGGVSDWYIDQKTSSKLFKWIESNKGKI